MSKPKNHPKTPLYTLEDSRQQNLTRAQVTRAGTTRLSSKVYAIEGYKPSSAELITTVARTMPGCIVNSVSAAKILGLRLPARLLKDETVYVAQGSAPHRYRREGVVCSGASIEPDDIITVNGTLCTSYQRTFFDLSTILSSDELVAVADGLLVHHAHRRNQRVPLLRRHELEDYIHGKGARRGVARCRRALSRSVTGSDSYMETMLRLMLEDAGIAGLECNVPVYDDDGYILFQPDLAIFSLRISIQYEGIHHGERQQVRRDVRRAAAVDKAGWIEVRLFKDDLSELVWVGDKFVPKAVERVAQAMRKRKCNFIP